MNASVPTDQESDSKPPACRVAQATRLSLLVDADRYFAAFRHAALTARRSLFILGWDVDTRTRLCGPDEPTDGYPAELLELLHALLDANDELHIYVIAWDFAVIYALERETFPSYRFQKHQHPRLHYVLDGHHPAGASHHQKLVVIDDEIAFVGGLDLTIRRWDTPDHRADNPRRVDPDGKPYAPFHDVQVAVQGPVAAVLGELARQRLARASDLVVEAPTVASSPKQPLAIAADVAIADVPVGVTRTEPASSAAGEPVQEVLASTLHTIASARELLYIENQYFTSAAITEALSARLGEPDGPHMIMVLPEAQTGWLERNSMGVLRERALARLREHDRHGHLHVYCALSDGACISVHSKLMIADDRLLRIGSSNLSNRSMGLDTECDIVVSARAEDGHVREGISAVLCHLLGEHLGCAPEQVGAHTRDARALVAFIESRRDSPRHLAPLKGQEAHASGAFSGLEQTLADPERPLALEDFAQELLPTRIERPAPRSALALIGFLLPLLLIAGLWQLDAVRELASVEGMTRALRLLRANPLGPLLVCGAFVLATQLFCPVTLLISATAIAFEPVLGFGYALLSAVLSASTSYAVGRTLAKRAPRAWTSGPRAHRIRRQLKTRGFEATLAARLLPLGNFTMINLLAGVLRVPFYAFVAGNFVGLIPGVFGLTLLAHRLGDTLAAPSLTNWILFIASAVLVFAVLFGVSKLFLRRTGILYTRRFRVVGRQRSSASRGAE